MKNNKQCDCKNPKTQDKTRLCGECNKYIDRVEHILLTNKLN